MQKRKKTGPNLDLARNQIVTTLRRRFDQGESLDSIAESIGVDRSTVWKWMNGGGIRKSALAVTLLLTTSAPPPIDRAAA